MFVYGFYLAVAVVITWPLVTVLNTRFLGHPFGDVYEYVHHSWWMQYALQTGQNPFYQSLLGYPHGLSSTWLWAIPLQSFPVALLALVFPLPLAYNLTALFRLALNGWAMYRLAQHLLDGRRGPALLAGLIFMTFPTFQGQLAIGHIGLLTLWPVPLLILALLRLQAWPATGPRPTRWIVAAGLLFAASLGGSLLLLIYLVGPVLLLMMIHFLRRRDWRALRRTILALALGGLIAAIFVVPFLLDPALPPQLRESGDVRYSADLLTLLTPSFYHPLFTNLPYTHQILGIDPFERLGYVGLIGGGLALVGFWKRRARDWLALAAVAWVLSLGPLLKVLDQAVPLNLGDQTSYVTLPGLLLQDVPLLNMARTPARFNFVIALATAILAGYGAAWLSDRLPRGKGIVLAVLAGLVLVDYQSFWPFPTIPGTVPAAVQALAERDDVRAVFNIPWTHLLVQKDGMFLQTGHHKPLLAGQIARRTPVNPAKLTLLEETLDPALLDREGVDVLILHKAWTADPAALQAQLPGTLLYEDDSIAVYEMPPAQAAPQFTALPADNSAFGEQIDSDVFTPESGWTTFSGHLRASGRDVTLRLDGQVVQVWPGLDDETFTLPIPLASLGYHTLTLTVDPPCPQHFDPALRCRDVQVDDLHFGDFTPQPVGILVPFAEGVTLAGYMVDAEARAVNLWWQFGMARSENDVRFIHVVDADGQLVAQDDRTLGRRPADSAWTETVTFADLTPGTYDVYTGWYTYPDFAHFNILVEVPGAADGWVYLGQLIVPEVFP